MKELLVFVREFVREARATGSVFPTSRRASEVLTAPLRERSRPLRILELGPGTGAVTTTILGSMRRGDHLDLCEVNQRFVALLKRRLASNTDFDTHRANVRFLCCPAQELPDGPPYDVIVCSLPFMNFDVATVAQIVTRLRHLSHASTLMTLYSYAFIRKIGDLVGGAAHRERTRAVSAYLDAQGRAPLLRVWWNAPPLTVYAIRTRPLIEAGRAQALESLEQAERRVA